MSARLRPLLENLVDLPSVADKHFLNRVIEELDRLHAESEKRGHPLLAALLEIARDEAEDDLKSRTESARLRPVKPSLHDRAKDDEGRFRSEDEGMLRIAQKLAWRSSAA